MHTNRLHYLIQAYLDKSCTEQEFEELKTLLLTNDDHDLDSLYDSLLLQDKTSVDRSAKREILNQIWNDPRIINIQNIKDKEPRRLWYYISAAALVLFILSFGYLKYGSKDAIISENQSAQIFPGTDKAQILLEDGSILNLDSSSNDALLENKGFHIKRGNGRELVFVYKGKSNSDGYHTVSTPKGGQIRLELPDGTLVWLNSESSMRFASGFNSISREVYSKGEVYLEVAKKVVHNHSIPFRVHTNGQTIEVLGTSFNVNSYTNKVITTLVEGKVKLSAPQKSSVILTPSQQAIFDQEFDVKNVDPLYSVAWKDGDFAFNKSSIEDVMVSIARWYDVDVQYIGDFDNDIFTGTISRYENLDKLLETMELTGSFKFKREGRKILVQKTIL